MNTTMRYTLAQAIDRLTFYRRVTASSGKSEKSCQENSEAAVSSFMELVKTKLCTLQIAKSQLSTTVTQSSNTAYSDMSLCTI